MELVSYGKAPCSVMQDDQAIYGHGSVTVVGACDQSLILLFSLRLLLLTVHNVTPVKLDL